MSPTPSTKFAMAPAWGWARRSLVCAAPCWLAWPRSSDRQIGMERTSRNDGLVQIGLARPGAQQDWRTARSAHSKNVAQQERRTARIGDREIAKPGTFRSGGLPRVRQEP